MLLSICFQAQNPLHSTPWFSSPGASLVLAGSKQKAKQKVVTRARRQGRVHSAEESRLDAPGLCLGTVLLVISEAEREIVLMPALSRVNIVGDWKWVSNSETRKSKAILQKESGGMGGWADCSCFLPPRGVHYSSSTTTRDPETRQTKPTQTCIGVSKKFQGASGWVPKGASLGRGALEREPPASQRQRVRRTSHRTDVLGRKEPIGTE